MYIIQLYFISYLFPFYCIYIYANIYIYTCIYIYIFSYTLLNVNQNIYMVFSQLNHRAAPCVTFHGVALTSRSARQILVHVGVFVIKPKVPVLNSETILVKILG